MHTIDTVEALAREMHDKAVEERGLGTYWDERDEDEVKLLYRERAAKQLASERSRSPDAREEK